jgi:hypothetical protein
MNTQMVNPRVIADIYSRAATKSEGAKHVLAFVREGLRQNQEDPKKGFKPEQVSWLGLGLALGVLDPYDQRGSFEKACRKTMSSEKFSVEEMLSESNPGLPTNAFQVITGELISAKVIEGYMSIPSIGDQLVTVMSNQRMRNQKIPGLTTLGGPNEVSEGHPYQEMGFGEKWVSTRESKKGRILSINAETLWFDQVGIIMRNAMTIGLVTQQERERTIVRGVIDADSTTNPVYRPSGVGTPLYASDGSFYNWIGVGNTVTGSPFNAASALQDWTDIQHVKRYRATAVKDDRIDGTPQVIGGINSGLLLLVPESLDGVAAYTVNASEVRVDDTNNRTTMANPVKGVVSGYLASPYLDEVSTADYYLGRFKDQFLWTEIWPLETFTQGAGSEAEFERDVAFRVKVRYYAGISALDTKLVTKVDGV